MGFPSPTTPLTAATIATALTYTPATFSRQIPIDLWGLPKTTVGAWVSQVLGLAPAGVTAYRQSSGAQNDSATWDFICGAGTFTLSFFHFTGANRGIYTVAIDGVTKGLIDGYTASTGSTVDETLTGLVLINGQHTITFTMATKNASSSNYFATISAAVLLQTA